MDITIENLIDLLENSAYMPSGKKSEALRRLEELSEDAEVPADLVNLVEELLESEANKAAEAADADESKIEKIDEEMGPIEEEQAVIIQADLKEDIEAMNEAVEEHKQKISEIEGTFEKEIEGEVSKGEEAEVDDIRKKLGIS